MHECWYFLELSRNVKQDELKSWKNKVCNYEKIKYVTTLSCQILVTCFYSFKSENCVGENISEKIIRFASHFAFYSC